VALILWRIRAERWLIDNFVGHARVATDVLSRG
jgi:hypothetical protein